MANPSTPVLIAIILSAVIAIAVAILALLRVLRSRAKAASDLNRLPSFTLAPDLPKGSSLRPRWALRSALKAATKPRSLDSNKCLPSTPSTPWFGEDDFRPDAYDPPIARPNCNPFLLTKSSWGSECSITRRDDDAGSHYSYHDLPFDRICELRPAVTATAQALNNFRGRHLSIFTLTEKKPPSIDLSRPHPLQRDGDDVAMLSSANPSPDHESLAAFLQHVSDSLSSVVSFVHQRSP
ncbi:hypothetical protein HK101_000533, partial [Irineochytrium annulatum]